MYSRLNDGRLNSWAESGPTPSIKSSPLSTEPSIEHRQQNYQNFISPQPSLTSFAFNFPIPSPDLRKIAEIARNRRRLASCPSFPSYPEEEISLVRSNIKWRKWRTIACPSLAFFEFLCFSKNCVVNLFVSPFQQFNTNKYFENDRKDDLGELLMEGDLEGSNALITIHNSEILSRRASVCVPDILQAPKAQLPRFFGQPVWYYRRRKSLQQFEAKQQKQLLQQQKSTTSKPDSPNQKSTKIISQTENYQPILRRKKRERLAKRYDPLIRFDWLALSPRIAVTEEGIPATMEQITERAHELTEMQCLPKQLATEHPVYQHIAELEHQTTESTISNLTNKGSTNLLEKPSTSRNSFESITLGLRAVNKWKLQTKLEGKRKSVAEHFSIPSTSNQPIKLPKGNKKERRMSLCPMFSSKRLNLDLVLNKEEEEYFNRERLNSNLSTSSTPATEREIIKRNLKEEFRQNAKSKFLQQRKNYLIKENLKKIGSLDLAKEEENIDDKTSIQSTSSNLTINSPKEHSKSNKQNIEKTKREK
uniref:Uncharacterized protein n=1 Tax=Meloidogyne hapla TaxID=6305 RepID=A0A1I8B396_MELHA